jgi:uncharacterized protein YktB (UPF0637 family)
MGADLIVYHFCIDENEDKKECERNMLREVDTLTKEEACEWENERTGEVLEPEEMSEDQFNKMKEAIKKNIKTVFDIIEGAPRDMTWFTHKGDTIYLTAGLSWGDLPTETAEDFDPFIKLPDRILEAGKIHW